jgi:excisionase family DNA binding protein
MNDEIIPRQEKSWKTKREIAAHFKCSVRTITSLMRRRVLPFVKQGRFVRFDTSDCDRAMEKLRSASIFDRLSAGGH